MRNTLRIHQDYTRQEIIGWDKEMRKHSRNTPRNTSGKKQEYTKKRPGIHQQYTRIDQEYIRNTLKNKPKIKQEHNRNKRLGEGGGSSEFFS